MNRSDFNNIVELCVSDKTCALDKQAKTSTAAFDDDRNSGRESYVSIDLIANEDLAQYDGTYPSERSEVEEIIVSTSASQETPTTTQQHAGNHSWWCEEGNSIVFSSIGDLIIKSRNANGHGEGGLGGEEGSQFFVASKLKEITFHEIDNARISRGDHRRHFFYVRNAPTAKLTSLIVTTIYRGDFVGSTYVPGELSVQLRRLSNNREPLVMMSNDTDDTEVLAPEVVGILPSTQRILNTEDEIGCEVIHYEMDNNATMVESGLMEVVVMATTDVNYSISVNGTIARAASLEVKREIASWLFKNKEAVQSVDKIASLDVEKALLERKMKIEEKLWNDAKQKCEKGENDIEAYDIALDGRDEMEDDGALIIERMKVLEVEYAHWSRLLSLRTTMKQNLQDKLLNIISDRNELVERRKIIEQGYDDCKLTLSQASSLLWGVKVSASIMNRLDSIQAETN